MSCSRARGRRKGTKREQASKREKPREQNGDRNCKRNATSKKQEEGEIQPHMKQSKDVNELRKQIRSSLLHLLWVS